MWEQRGQKTIPIIHKTQTSDTTGLKEIALRRIKSTIHPIFTVPKIVRTVFATTSTEMAHARATKRSWGFINVS